MAQADPSGQNPAFGDLLERLGLLDTEASPVDELPPKRIERLRGDDLEQLIKLKKIYGFGILALMTLQLIAVNVGFALYSGLGWDWAPPDGVVQIWITATFVQIVAIVVVITKSLFPPDLPTRGLR